MQLHQLEYVLAVAKYSSFTHAAEEINISQSSLSQQISTLEKELGINLFVRTTRSVYLTSVGQDFVTHAMRIMSEVTSAYQCIQEYVSVDKGLLTIGVIPVIGHYPIPELFAAFNRDFPGVTLSLIENQDDSLLEMLNDSKLDAAIVQYANIDSPFQYFPLYTDRMVLLTSCKNHLASKKSIDLKELKNEKFILTPLTSGHQHDFIKACKAQGFEPKILMTCSSVKTMLGLARENMGVTVLSSKVAISSIPPDSGICLLELTPLIERKVFLAIQKNANVTPALKVFVKYVSQWITSRENSLLGFLFAIFAFPLGISL